MDERKRTRVRDEILGPIAADADAVLVGPWLGEVGYEVLYWIPLLRWCVRERPDLRQRIVVLSRGGVARWYEGIGASYLDLFDRYDRREFVKRLHRDRKEKRDAKLTYKQSAPGRWDDELRAWVRESLGVQRLEHLHPGLVHAHRGFIRRLAQCPDSPVEPWTRPDRGSLAAVLPREYVAVRFYHNAVFRRTERTMAFVRDLIGSVAARLPVVLLDPEMQIDPSHPDFEIDTGVVSLSASMTFRNNLDVQSIAMAHARAFVGTYGGLSYVPPHYGVPTHCFWAPEDQDRIVESHLDLARHVYNRPGWAGYTAESIADATPCDVAARVLGMG